MTHVSRKKLENNVLNKILDFLVISLTDIKDEGEMRDFLDAFLTSTEKIMLAKRLGVAYLLSEKWTEDQISEALCVGKPTIQRMKLWLKTEGKGYILALEILKKNEKFEEFKGVFVAILHKLAHPYRGLISGAYYQGED